MNRQSGNSRHQLTIRSLGVSFLLLVVLLVSVCLYSYIRANQVRSEYSNNVFRTYKQLELVNELLNNKEQTQTLLRTHLLAKSSASKDSLRQKVAVMHMENETIFLELNAIIVDPTRRQLLTELIEERQRYKMHADSLLMLSDSDLAAEAQLYSKANLAPFYSNHQLKLVKLSDGIANASRKRTQEAISGFSSIVDEYALLLLLAISASVWAAFVLFKVFKRLHRENSILSNEVYERKELQQALENSQMQYKRLFNKNPVPMWVYDQTTLRFLEVNKAAVQEYGYTHEEFLSMTLKDIRPASEVGKLMQRMQSIDKDSDAGSKGYTHKHKEGHTFKVELKSHSLPKQEGIYPRLVVALNVQEREQAMEQLEKSARQLHEVSSSLPGAVFQYQLNSDGTFSFPFISEGIADICSVLPAAIYNDPALLFNTIHPDDLADIHKSIQESYSNLTPWIAELRVWKPAQIKYGWIRGHSLPTCKGNGTVTWNGTLIDITDQKEAQEQLTHNEANLRALLDSSPQAIYLLDAEHRIVAFNAVARNEVQRLSLQELSTGQDILDIIDPDQQEQFHDNHTKAMQGLNIQYEQGTGDFWHEVTFKPVFDAEGQVINVTLSVHNRTDQKKAIETIKKNETQLAKAQRLAKIGSWEYDLQKDLLTMSRTFHDIVSFTDPDYAPSLRSLIAFLHPDDKQTVLNQVEEIVCGKEDFNFEHRIVLSDGSTRYLYHITETVCDEAGKPILVTGTTQDISDRKLAEREVTEAKNLLQSTIENIPEVIFSTNTDFVMTYMSPQCREVTGYSEESFIGNKLIWQNTIYSADKEVLLQEVLPKVLAGHQQQHEARIVTPDGSIKWVLLRLSPKKDEKGNVVRIDGAASDITQNKETEAKRLKLTEQLLKQNQNLQQFAYIVSHNMRAPIANLLGLVSIYNRQTPEIPTNNLVIDNIVTSAQLLDTTIRDLNDLLTMRSESEPVQEQVCFQELAEEVLVSLKPEIKACGACVTYSFDLAPRAMAIRSYVHSILYNLVSNAIKFRKPDQNLTVSINTYEVNNYLCLSIRDNGLGIDLEKQNGKVFGLYKRFHHKIEGKGIGLHLVKTQAELLGGKVEVESQPLIGTTFHVYLKLQKHHEHLEESSFN